MTYVWRTESEFAEFSEVRKLYGRAKTFPRALSEMKLPDRGRVRVGCHQALAVHTGVDNSVSTDGNLMQ